MDINAEKNKFGFLYVIKIEGTAHENLHKIGITWRTVAKRKHELVKGAPFLKYTLVSFIRFHNCRYFEKTLHNMLREYRIVGEYFNVDSSIIDETVEEMAFNYVDATPDEEEIPMTKEEINKSNERMNAFESSGMSIKDWIVSNLNLWATETA